ncbi:hypothetical protein D3C72_2140140 [compost metagenome]
MRSSRLVSLSDWSPWANVCARLRSSGGHRATTDGSTCGKRASCVAAMLPRKRDLRSIKASLLTSEPASMTFCPTLPVSAMRTTSTCFGPNRTNST